MSVTIEVKVLPHGEGLALPAYATAGAAGADLIAALSEREPLTLAPLQRFAVPTGLSLAIPEGYEAQLRPRSGLALKQGVTLLNAPGTIDWDYRGEVKVILVNLSDATVTIERGMRIAQLVIAPVTRAVFAEVKTLDDTVRGAGGFGSTGTHS